jgi:trigger factor
VTNVAQVVDAKKGQGGDGSALAAVLEQTREVIPYELVEQERLPGSRIRFKVKVGPGDFARKLDATFKEFGKVVALPGFRPGKAPETLVRRRYDAAAREETVKRLVPRLSSQFAADHKLEPLSETYLLGFKSDAATGAVIELALEIHPEIGLTEEKLSGIAVTAHRVTITDAVVDQMIEHLRLQNATYEPTEAAFAEKDAMVFTCEVRDAAGTRIDYRCAKDYYCKDVEGELPEEVAKALVGRKAGDVVELDVMETEDDGSATTVHYRVEVKEVKARVLPVVDDEFAKDVSDKYTNVAELRAGLRERAEKQEIERQRQEAVAEIMAQLRARFEFDVPRGLLVREMRARFADTERSLNQMGMSLNYLDADMVRRYETSVEHNARLTVKNALLARAVARHFGIQPTEADIQAELERLAAQTGRKALAIRGQLEARKEWDAFLNSLTARLTDDKLMALASVSWKDATVEELREIARARQEAQAAILRGEEAAIAAADARLAEIAAANEAANQPKA